MREPSADTIATRFVKRSVQLKPSHDNRKLQSTKSQLYEIGNHREIDRTTIFSRYGYFTFNALLCQHRCSGETTRRFNFTRKLAGKVSL